MDFEIDQSGKVESTRNATVLALSNGVQHTIFISAVEKRKVFQELEKLRPEWKKKQSLLTVFSILVFLLIRDHLKPRTYIAIDVEYQGQEFFIKDQVARLCRKHGLSLRREQISFRLVGKKSPAHHAAVNTFRGKRKPDRIIEAKDVIAEA